MFAESNFHTTMADKKKIMKYYRKADGRKGYGGRDEQTIALRSSYPQDINTAISQLQVDIGQPPKTFKSNLLFAAARIGLGLDPINEV